MTTSDPSPDVVVVHPPEVGRVQAFDSMTTPPQYIVPSDVTFNGPTPFALQYMREFAILWPRGHSPSSTQRMSTQPGCVSSYLDFLTRTIAVNPDARHNAPIIKEEQMHARPNFRRR